MRVDMLRGKLVQIQQGLVHALFQLQRTLHGLQPAPPLVTLGFLCEEKHQVIAAGVLQHNVSHQKGVAI